MGLQVTLYAIIVIISICLYLLKERMSYWKKRNIPHDEPTFFYGNMRGVMRTRHIRDLMQDLYMKYKGSGPYCGAYLFFQPIVIALDQEFIKNVLIKDFSNFVDRAVYHNEKDDPLTGNLFGVEGYRWRQLRTRFSPTFTSGKLRQMFPVVLDIAGRFEDVFTEMVGAGGVLEIKEILARFSTDVIGTCAFGIECNSLRDPNAEFRLVGQRFIDSPRHSRVILAIIRSCPDIARYLGCCTVPTNVSAFFMRIVRETVEFREKNDIVRNDFMNMLIEMKNNKSMMTENGKRITSLTLDEMAAQAFVFYLGGFESSSSTVGYSLYELAQNHTIQDKLRKEVMDVLAKYGGVLTYDSIADLTYMDQAISETLRKYPILSILNRKSKADYKVPGTNRVIEKGTMIFIPCDAIHRDPEFYPNPDVYDPDRFSPEEFQKRSSTTYLAFGDGPRNCVGKRFGKMVSKIGLSLLLSKFKFYVSEKTQIPLEFNLKLNILSTKSGIHLRVEPIKGL